MPTHRVVSIDELSQYLHLPEKAVAKELGLCLTSLKKLCRQHGITRWPYRKLKSLDKKIARAENGADTAEDAATQQARAEEFRKEKMAIAFTYGLKPPGYTAKKAKDKQEMVTPPSESATPPAVDMMSVEEVLVAEVTRAVSKPRKPELLDSETGSSLPLPASVLAKSAPHVWSSHTSRDSPTSIPTPPDTEAFDTVGEGVDADLLSEAAENVMASNALLEDTRMSSSISWEAPSLDDSPVEPVADCPGGAGADCDTPSSLSSIPEFSAAEAGDRKIGGAGSRAGSKGGPDSAGTNRSAKSGKGKNAKVQEACPAEGEDLGEEADLLDGSPRKGKVRELFVGSTGGISSSAGAHASMGNSPAAAQQRPRFAMDEHDDDGSESFFGQELLESDFFSVMEQGGSMRSADQASMPPAVPAKGLTLSTDRLGHEEEGEENLPPVALMGESHWDLWPGAGVQTPGSGKDVTPGSKDIKTLSFPTPPKSPGSPDKAQHATRSSTCATVSAASTALKTPHKGVAAACEEEAEPASSPAPSAASSPQRGVDRQPKRGATAEAQGGSAPSSPSRSPRKSLRSGKRGAGGPVTQKTSSDLAADARVTRSRRR